MQVSEAYAACRAIARKQAKNFYYAFLALPKAKRDAICAVYAFMRHADDLSDDETISLGERRANLDAWLKEWHEAASGAEVSNPVFIALRDAQHRFGISSGLLDQLVEGTTMDLHREIGHPSAFDTYATFHDLYRYCYLVASVVGLVCIRIFGYSDTRAEKLAEETGIAFQLTNIIRDVREDAERGRIYLPLEDMAQFGVAPYELAQIRDGRGLTPKQRDLLAFEAARAERHYESGKQLLPFIDADSRPAMWVLMTIYRRTLRFIEKKNYDVFSARVSVPTHEKLAILAIGLAGVFKNRLLGRS